MQRPKPKIFSEASGGWALFIGAVAAPSYCVVFAAWQLLLRRVPAWDATRRRRTVTAWLLGMPPALLLIWGFGSSSLGFNWGEAARIAPLALISCGAGAWLPRRLLKPLQGQLVAFAV